MLGLSFSLFSPYFLSFLVILSSFAGLYLAAIWQRARSAWPKVRREAPRTQCAFWLRRSRAVLSAAASSVLQDGPARPRRSLVAASQRPKLCVIAEPLSPIEAQAEDRTRGGAGRNRAMLTNLSAYSAPLPLRCRAPR